MVKQFESGALSVKVEAIDNDMREVKDSILGLDAKIEKAVTDLAREVRAAIQSLSTQFTERERAFAERQRTPWGVLISAAVAIVGVLGIFGTQALSPIQNDIKSLKEKIVPREEINFRSDTTVKRLEVIEQSVIQTQNRRYEEMQRQIERLQDQNTKLIEKSP